MRKKMRALRAQSDLLDPFNALSTSKSMTLLNVDTFYIEFPANACRQSQATALGTIKPS
jgi:hypothetical protein